MLLFVKPAMLVTGTLTGVCKDGMRWIPQIQTDPTGAVQWAGLWSPAPCLWPQELSASPSYACRLVVKVMHLLLPCVCTPVIESPTSVLDSGLFFLRRARPCPRTQPPSCFLVHKNSTLSSALRASTVCVYVTQKPSTKPKKAGKHSIRPLM